MNKNKICTILYLGAAICFYLAAILNVFSRDVGIESITNVMV